MLNFLIIFLIIIICLLNVIIFLLALVITFLFNLINWAVIPFSLYGQSIIVASIVFLKYV